MHGMMRLALLGVPGGSGASIIAYAERALAVESDSLTAAWILDKNALDSSGNGCDGTPSATVAFSAEGIGDGRKMAAFNGVDGNIDTFSAALGTLFDSAEGSVLLWYRSPEAIPSATLVAFRGPTTHNYTRVFTSSVNSSINIGRRADSATVEKGGIFAPGLHSIVMTWSVPDNKTRLYVNGLFITDVACATWAAGNTQLNASSIGSFFTLSGFTAGDIGHVYVWSTPLNDRDILDLASPEDAGNIFYPILHDKNTYSAFGLALVLGGSAQIYTRKGTGHVENTGAIIRFSPAAVTREWTETAIVDTADLDDRNLAGGVASTGTALLFWGTYDADTSTWNSLVVSRSTDNGVTWGAPSALSPSDERYSPYGPLVELPSGALLQSFYGSTGATRRVYTLKSSDDGVTWGSEVVIVTTTPSCSETAICYLDGATDGASRLIAVARNAGGGLQQFSSDDGGATWSLDGSLPFSGGVDVDVSPWLYNDSGTIHLLYADRTTMQLKHATGVPNDVFGDVDGWGAPEAIYDSPGDAGEFGYPSIVEVSGELYVTFNNELDTRADMMWGKLPTA